MTMEHRRRQAQRIVQPERSRWRHSYATLSSFSGSLTAGRQQLLYARPSLPPARSMRSMCGYIGANRTMLAPWIRTHRFGCTFRLLHSRFALPDIAPDPILSESGSATYVSLCHSLRVRLSAIRCYANGDKHLIANWFMFLQHTSGTSTLRPGHAYSSSSRLGLLAESSKGND